MHIHFRANMDFWDPLLINNLAAKRPVIIFDQAGVRKSDSEVATNYQGWANKVIVLIDVLGLKQIDLLGFSMGGCAVQMVALTRPDLVRKLIIAGSGPSMPASREPTGIVWPRDVPPEKPIVMLATGTTKDEVEKGIGYSFFPDTDAGRATNKAYFSRIYKRTPETTKGEQVIHSLPDPERTKRQRLACVDWSTPNPRNSFDRLGKLEMPVLIVNGENDLLVPRSRSWELLKGIENARLIVYPQAGHGFIWQYVERVAEDVNKFLDCDLGRLQAKL